MKRNHSLYMLIAIAAFFGTVCSAYAQERDEMMNKLSFLIADWAVTEKAGDTGTGDKTYSKINWAHDGTFIEERAKYKTKYGEINMITFIGFDNRIKKYKLCAMDKEFGLMDVYYGNWIDDKLVFTNIDSDKAIQMENGKKLNFRLTYAMTKDDNFIHTVEGTYDRGESWFLFSNSHYSQQ